MNPSRSEVEALIRLLAKPRNLDADLLIRQCQAESSFRQDARSGCGAIGLFQLMPPTAKDLKVDPLDWRENVEGGIRYLGSMRKMFGGDYAKALAAYNWGPGNMQRLLKAHPADWRDRLPDETTAYLNRILGPELPPAA